MFGKLYLHSYLPFLCSALALEIQLAFNIDTEVRASKLFCNDIQQKQHLITMHFFKIVISNTLVNYTYLNIELIDISYPPKG